ncbi:hypothetical protein HYT57_03815 [Candidatus Woesearchaeota archaeon]|nr:hypothetical protein [Candidatus Woesearchaeota archaeon]
MKINNIKNTMCRPDLKTKVFVKNLDITTAKPLIYIFVIGFILNLIWEYLHYPLYKDLSGIPSNLHLWLAAFFDAFFILTIILLISLKNSNFSWTKKPKTIDYILAIIIPLIIAIMIEIINLDLGRWEYSFSMPTIFGLGLSPLIQLPLITIISLFLVRK